MKILLTAVNAKYIHSNPAVFSLASYAKKMLPASLFEGNSIEIAEYTINQEIDEILKDIYERKADVICFSCYIWNIKEISALIDDINQIYNGKISVFLGGPEVSYNAKEWLNRPYVKGVFVGEGERSFMLFAKKLFEACSRKEKTGPVDVDCILEDEIEGLATAFHINSMPIAINLDDLPFLYTDENLKNFENRIIYYESSRGCPFRCSYCLSSLDKSVRYRNLDIVKKELQFFLDHKLKQVKFVDRTFNCDPKRSREIWDYLIRHDNGITNFHFEIAADLITEELLSVMEQMRPGLIQLEIGVQTTNEKTLREIRRPSLFENVAYVTNRIKQSHNIHLHLDLIAGLPYEDMESFKHSFHEVYSLHPDELQLGFLKVLKGSYMEEMAKEYELVYSSRPPFEVFSTKWLSYEDIILLKKVENILEQYYNSGLYRSTMAVLERDYKENTFALYEDIAVYFENHGYDRVSHNRIRRIELLYEFAKNRWSEENEYLEMIKEALLFDLYRHEKAKSRPNFAPEIQGTKKELIRNFYQNEVSQNYPHFTSEYYRSLSSKTLANMTQLEVFRWDFTQENFPQKDNLILFSYEQKEALHGDGKAIKISDCFAENGCQFVNYGGEK